MQVLGVHFFRNGRVHRSDELNYEKKFWFAARRQTDALLLQASPFSTLVYIPKEDE
jgi:hypothetical protein